MKIFITGGTGLIGRRLIRRLLARGDRLTVLTRNAASARSTVGSEVALLEGVATRAGDWQGALAGHDAVVNLMGEPIADRAWTPDQLRRIRESRVDATNQLARAIAQARRSAAGHSDDTAEARVGPRVLIQGSAVGYYGDADDRLLSESAPAGRDPLAQLCVEWEAAAEEARTAGCRVVLLRTGIVLDPSGGALQKLMLPFKLFAGGPMGSGAQWFPWIHPDDLVGLICFSLDQEAIQGPINGAAPGIVQATALSTTLGRVLHRPSWLPVPRFALQLALGDRAGMLLASQRVVPARAQAHGYVFQHPELEPALRSLLQT